MYDNLLKLSVTPENAPDKPAFVEIYFENGEPQKIDSKDLSPIELISYLNNIGGKNGIGIVDIVENRLVGMKSRGVYETQEAQYFTKSYEPNNYALIRKPCISKSISQKYAELVYNGQWYTPLEKL